MFYFHMFINEPVTAGRPESMVASVSFVASLSYPQPMSVRHFRRHWYVTIISASSSLKKPPPAPEAMMIRWFVCATTVSVSPTRSFLTYYANCDICGAAATLLPANDDDWPDDRKCSRPWFSIVWKVSGGWNFINGGRSCCHARVDVKTVDYFQLHAINVLYAFSKQCINCCILPRQFRFVLLDDFLMMNVARCCIPLAEIVFNCLFFCQW